MQILTLVEYVAFYIALFALYQFYINYLADKETKKVLPKTIVLFLAILGTLFFFDGFEAIVAIAKPSQFYIHTAFVALVLFTFFYFWKIRKNK